MGITQKSASGTWTIQKDRKYFFFYCAGYKWTLTELKNTVKEGWQISVIYCLSISAMLGKIRYSMTFKNVYLKVNEVLDHMFIPEETIIHL